MKAKDNSLLNSDYRTIKNTKIYVIHKEKFTHSFRIRPAFVPSRTRSGADSGANARGTSELLFVASPPISRQPPLTFFSFHSSSSILHASLSCYVQLLRLPQSSLMSVAEKRTTVLLSVILIIGFVYYFSRDVSNEAQLWKFNRSKRSDVLKRK